MAHMNPSPGPGRRSLLTIWPPWRSRPSWSRCLRRPRERPALLAIQACRRGAHTCVLFTTGNLRCRGNNSYGQLGLGNTTNIGDGSLSYGNTTLLPATSRTTLIGR